jgi:3-deoxy-D-manno-octulosonic-acid transferase
MSKSIGLALYFLAASRTPKPGAAPPLLPSRPDGEPRIWLHAQSSRSLRALTGLAARLHAQRPGLGLILTHFENARLPGDALPPGCLTLPALPDDPAHLRAALARWGPQVLVLGDGALPPALIHEADSAGVPILLVNARQPQLDGAWVPWPGLQRALLRGMRRILVQDRAAARAFRRAGAPVARLEEVGPMAEGTAALPCTPAERDALARRLGVRPVWLAVAVPEAEEATVLAAHCAAQRMAHRLLLIVVPADPARGPGLAELARDMGIRTARRGADEEPSNDDQLYVADTEGELGLWYRLAPITFMGGTLGDGPASRSRRAPPVPAAAGGRDPFEPAALGSAIVHGPATGAYREVYDRFTRARAARRVDGAEALAAAVGDLLAPDRVALMAHSAWAVATRGAEATDRVAELVLATLEEGSPA